MSGEKGKGIVFTFYKHVNLNGFKFVAHNVNNTQCTGGRKIKNR